MAAPGDTRNINRFLPPLFHLAVVKIAVPLFKEFGLQTLDRVFTDIQHGNSARFNKRYHNNRIANRAKEKLLSIPERLRHSVLKAVTGLQRAVYSWHRDHRPIGSQPFWLRGPPVVKKNCGPLTKFTSKKLQTHIVHLYNICIPGWHREFTDMSCCRISEQELASPGGIVMVELWVPPPVIVPGGVRPWPGDWLLGLRPQYSSYYSGCHSDDPDAWSVWGQTQFLWLWSILYELICQ
ncbi:hypothetical protein AVEN_6595-1 [Araneus ventricosus]|uniref:Uncharacterized protein n=1 Tax=Araneus ventricosus TaxID=182803 RepID=A0A4Y2LKN9_ARAVE|nr:hypothetical protein AVEN_6595-1 [Araneus ventricosus]